MRKLVLLASMFLSTSVLASDFGTESDVDEVIPQLKTLIESEGVDAATAALNDSSHALGGHDIGIMFWVDGKMAMHNKYPDLAGMNFDDLQDLRGNFVINEFTEAANEGRGMSLNYWPHYETEEEYEYKCYSEWVEQPRIMITACI